MGAAEAQLYPRCPVCRREVRGDADGVAFGAGGKFLFAACHEHAPFVRAGVRVASRAAWAGLVAFVERRFPALYDLIDEAVERRRELRP